LASGGGLSDAFQRLRVDGRLNRPISAPFQVVRSLRASVSRLTRRKIAPFLVSAAVILSSTARLAQMGTGNGPDVLSLTTKSAITAVLRADLEIFHSLPFLVRPIQRDLSRLQSAAQ
jgi:hypothetical protein